MVEKVRVAIATGEASKERWYLLTSLPPHRCSPGEMLRLFRSHWSIENNLHHVKDRSWDEDRHTLRRPGLGEVFATLVNVSLNTLRLACVWKDGFLPECPCRCEPRPVPSARDRLSPVSSDTQPDFAIVLVRDLVAAWFQDEPCLSMEFRITSSLRMQAVKASFFGLPAHNRRW